MKKFIVLFSIVIIVVVTVAFNYMNYTNEQNEIKNYNLEFEKNYQKEIYGIDLTTIINRVINNNENNNVEKDQNNRYINNETNSIKIEVKMTDIDEVFAMETLYNGGMEQFVQYYANIQFKCTKIEYHKKTGKISYMYFEQISE